MVNTEATRFETDVDAKAAIALISFPGDGKVYYAFVGYFESEERPSPAIGYVCYVHLSSGVRYLFADWDINAPQA